MLGLYHHGLQCHQRIVSPGGTTLVSRGKKFFAVIRRIKVSMCGLRPLLMFVSVRHRHHLIFAMAFMAMWVRQGYGRPERHRVAFPCGDNGGGFGQHVAHIERLQRNLC